MPDHLAFIIRSSEKVLEHCRVLLDKPLNAQERARLHARVEAEREFIARLREGHGQRAA